MPIGYSGHERGLQTTLAAVALGAVIVERHITLDRDDVGLRPGRLGRAAGPRRAWSATSGSCKMRMGDGVKRVFPGELAPLSRLRRVDG